MTKGFAASVCAAEDAARASAKSRASARVLFIFQLVPIQGVFLGITVSVFQADVGVGLPELDRFADHPDDVPVRGLALAEGELHAQFVVAAAALLEPSRSAFPG